MTSTVLLILANLFVYNARLRFANRLLQFHQNKIPIIVGLVFCGVVSSLIMLGYHPFLSLISFSQAGFSDTITTSSFPSYIVYLVGLIYLVHTISSRIQRRDYIQIIVFVGIWIGVSILASLGIIQNIALYYIFIAFGEEILKYEFGSILYKRFQVNVRDIIIFSILSALSFAIVENIVYLVNSETLSSLGSANKLLFQRGIMTASLHAVFTGLIGYGLFLADKQKNRFYMPLAILGGIGVHWLYNITMYNQLLIIMPLFMIGSYLILSFLTFQTDILYRQADNS